MKDQANGQEMSIDQAEERVAGLLYAFGQPSPADLSALEMVKKSCEARIKLLEENADNSHLRGVTDNNAINLLQEKLGKIEQLINRVQSHNENH